MGGGGGEEGGRKEGGKQKIVPGLSGLQGRARQFIPGQTGLPIILCLGKTTFKQGSIPGNTVNLKMDSSPVAVK